MTSPSERYLAAKERTGHARTHLGVFEQSLGFDLDPFQLEACRSVEAGRGVLVAAPTGAGKTVVGEFAVYMALERGPQGLLHHPHQGPEQPEIHRARPRPTAQKTWAC